jgi:hypothetical protein
VDERTADSSALLFHPQLTYRVRRNNGTDTPLPPEIPAGQNPPDGAMLDYWLKTPPSGPVVLEVLDSAGKSVRRFSSADKPSARDDKELNVPTYWIRPERTVSAAAGMHRFIWDLHYPPPDTLEREYPISAIYRDTPLYPLGASVLPGTYTVKLTVAGQTYTQPLNIKMDPRVRASPDDLKAQFEMEMKIVEEMHQDFQALVQVRSLRKKLKDLQTTGKPKLQAAIADLDKKAAELEGTPGGYGATFLSTPEGRSLARLNTALKNLLGIVDSADAAPTSQAVATFADVHKALADELARWTEIQNTDVQALNRELKQARMAVIDLKSMEETPEAH